MAVAVTVPIGVIVAVSVVALGAGDESVAAPPQATSPARRTSAQTRIPLGTSGGGRRFPLSRPAATNVTGRIHLRAQREDLVVDPTGREHRLLGLLPARRTPRQEVLLPHHE